MQFAKLVVLAGLVCAVGCAQAHDGVMVDDLPEEEPTVSKPVPQPLAQSWYAEAEPARPACRTIKGYYDQQQAIANCHTLFREVAAYGCSLDARVGVSSCTNGTDIQWEPDGSATVFVNGEFDAFVGKPNPSSRTVAIEFENGSRGACNIKWHEVTLCIHGDPAPRF